MNRLDTDNLSFQDWKNSYEEARGHDTPEFGKDKVKKKNKQIYEVVNLVYRRLIFGQCSITLYFQPRHIPQQYLRIAIRHYI